MKTNIYTKGDIDSGAILFIHGNSLNAESFRKVFDTISDIPLIAVDLPGHGLSEKAVNPQEVYSLPGYVNTVKQLIAEFNLHDFIIAGHSLGGHIAIEASEELAGLKGLAAFGTPPLGIPPDMANAFLPNEAMGLLFQKDLTEEEMMLLCSSLVDETNKHLHKNILAQLQSSDGNARLHLLHNIAAGKQKDELAITKYLKVPLAIFHGEKDPVVNLEYISSVSCPTLWQNKIQIIENSGHSPHLENPLSFSRLLKNFYHYVFSLK